VFLSPGGDVMATTSEDSTVRLWDARRGIALTGMLRQHAAPVRQADFSPDGRQLVTEDSTGLSYLWDVADGRPIVALPPATYNPQLDVAFSPDGTRVALASFPTKVVEITDSAKVTETPYGEATTVAVGFSDDGMLLAGARPGNRTVEVWDVASTRGASPCQ